MCAPSQADIWWFHIRMIIFFRIMAAFLQCTYHSIKDLHFDTWLFWLQRSTSVGPMSAPPTSPPTHNFSFQHSSSRDKWRSETKFGFCQSTQSVVTSTSVPPADQYDQIMVINATRNRGSSSTNSDFYYGSSHQYHHYYYPHLVGGGGGSSSDQSYSSRNYQSTSSYGGLAPGSSSSFSCRANSAPPDRLYYQPLATTGDFNNRPLPWNSSHVDSSTR